MNTNTTQRFVVFEYQTPRGKMSPTSTRGWSKAAVASVDKQGRLRIEQALMVQTCVADFFRQQRIANPNILRACIDETLRELVPLGPFFQLMASQNKESDLIKSLKIGTHVVLGCRFRAERVGMYVEQNLLPSDSPPQSLMKKVFEKLKKILRMGSQNAPPLRQVSQSIQGYPAIVWDGEEVRFNLLTAEELFLAARGEIEDIFIFEVRSV